MERDNFWGILQEIKVGKIEREQVKEWTLKESQGLP